MKAGKGYAAYLPTLTIWNLSVACPLSNSLLLTPSSVVLELRNLLLPRKTLSALWIGTWLYV
jgi:hypothetical protein